MQVAALLSSTALRNPQIMDIIEFGRMIHAEMLAISDAARLGRSTKGATLYCKARRSLPEHARVPQTSKSGG